jgi:branched-chain amino acid transport system permease protein
VENMTEENLYFFRQGMGDTKVVFLHGNSGSTRWWRPVMNALQKEYYMLAVDMRGFGRSPDGQDNVSLADHARELYDLVSELNFSDFILVGHSLGGGVAMQFAATYPELLKGMVLVDSSPLGGLKGIDYEFLASTLNSSAFVAGLRATFAGTIDESYFAELAEDSVRALGVVIPNTRALEASDFTGTAGNFAKPVLVVHGEQDILIPLSESQKTAASFPKGRLALISGSGHNPQVEKPEEFVQQLRNFISSI